MNTTYSRAITSETYTIRSVISLTRDFFLFFYISVHIPDKVGVYLYGHIQTEQFIDSILCQLSVLKTLVSHGKEFIVV